VEQVLHADDLNARDGRLGDLEAAKVIHDAHTQMASAAVVRPAAILLTIPRRVRHVADQGACGAGGRPL
jgi:hypothetical protein